MNTINASSKKPWGIPTQGKKFLSLALRSSITCLAFLSLSGCALTREQVDAATWLNNFDFIQHNAQLDELCGTKRSPGPLRQLVLYRKLNNGKFQTVPICDIDKNNPFFSVNSADYQKILEALAPKKR